MQRVNFNFPDEVYHTMTFKASALGVNNTTYIKSLIMEQTILSADNHKNYTRALGLLGNLTGNINQIALNLNRANTQGALSRVDYDTLINMLTLILNNTESCFND
jgi:hypothetical protein